MASTTAELFVTHSLSALCDRMFSNGSVLAAVILPDLRCAYLSPNHKRITGWNHIDLQSHWLAHVHPDDRAEMMRMLKTCLFEPGQHFSYDYRLHHSDGRWRWYRADIQNSNSFSCFDDKFMDCTMVLSAEITELKSQHQHNDEIRRSEQMMEEHRRAMLSHLNHELRTPLNAISGFAELVRDKMNPDKVDDYIAYIKESAHAMERALDRMALVGQQFVTNAVLTEGTYDIREILKNVEDIVANVGIRLDAAMPAFAVWCYVDSTRLQKALADIFISIAHSGNNVLPISCALNNVGEMEISVELSEPAMCQMASVLGHDALSAMHIAHEDHNAAFLLCLAAQLLRQHQVNIRLDDKEKPALVLSFPPSRILSTQEISQ